MNRKPPSRSIPGMDSSSRKKKNRMHSVSPSSNVSTTSTSDPSLFEQIPAPLLIPSSNVSTNSTSDPSLFEQMRAPLLIPSSSASTTSTSDPHPGSPTSKVCCSP